jgi:hypothetical protein
MRKVISWTSLSAVTTLLGVCAAQAPAALVTGPWTNAPGQGDGPITNANTASPTVGDGTANSAEAEMFDSPFSPITLANSGDKIIFTGNVTLTGSIGGASAPRTQFRFGLFDGDDTGPDDNGWVGYYMSNSSGNGSPSGVLARKPNPNTSVYLSVTGQNVLASTPGNGVNFTDDTYAMSLTIQRSGNDLTILGILSGATNGFIQSLSATDTTASTSSTYTFDHLGFLLGGNLDTDQAQFSNLDVTFIAIPEASCVAMFSLICGLVVAAKLRRTRSATDAT